MRRMRIGPIVGMVLCAPLLLGNDGCEPKRTDTGVNKEAHATALALNQAATVIGMPAIINWHEKRMAKMLYELRDNPHLVTYSYTVDMQGRRHSVCPTTSVGYGVPYSVQYTASETLQQVFDSGVNTIRDRYEKLPQAEPNGLYMPSNADATWIMCLSPNGKDVTPAYVEPHVVVYQWEMPHVD